ncbi:MAG: acylneuraminate cytidylyltransferase family protein [Leptospiraceae bacterium]|nr:acylneuraminate cytidylyltransferase family protein [Leptospiraceae bacterium]
MLVLEIIPARGGSKGIPGKNLVSLGGKPLLAWTVEAAIELDRPSRVVVSSDSDEIGRVASRFGAEYLRRPAELARDDSLSIDVLSHAVESLGPFENPEEVILILLQPTSPFRTTQDIERAVTMIAEQKADAAISVVEPGHSPLKAFITDDRGFLKAAVNPDYPFLPRQKLPQAYMANGAIYALRLDRFLFKPGFLTDRTGFIVMSPEASIDIDSPEDLATARRRVGE